MLYLFTRRDCVMAAFAGLSNHRECTMSASSPADADNTKRRSSSRNIKRPKFDDELVESSLGGQGLPPLPKFRARNPSISVTESPVPPTPVSLLLLAIYSCKYLNIVIGFEMILSCNNVSVIQTYFRLHPLLQRFANE